MATAAELRKHAEKIQRDALQARLDAVQPLIDDLSKRETLTEKVAALQTEITELDTSIGVHYRAALNGGWTADELAAANLNVPKTATRKRASTPRVRATALDAPVGESTERHHASTSTTSTTSTNE